MRDETFRRLCEVAHNLGIKRDETAGVAVSGGSDSLAMLFLLHEAGWRLEAATVDHGLRPEAPEEAALVARVCAARRIPHETLRLDLSDARGNLQDQARRARYGALRDWARARGVRYVALAHTADDQAETFLMRLARGAGLDGLSGMSARREDGDVIWCRPFLTVRRAELRAYLEHRGICWIDDPTNDDEAFERVRMRKAMEVLEPLGITPEQIGLVTRNLKDVRSELDLRAREAFLASCREDKGDLIFPMAALAASKPGGEVRRRMMVAALLWVSGAEYPPRRDAVQYLGIAIRNGERHTLAGCVVTPDENVRFFREYNAVRNMRGPTDALWDGRWRLTGPHAPDLEVGALGEAVKDTPWRETGMPRQSLLASPAVWQGETLVAAPVAGLSNGWRAEATGRGNFADFLICR